jgi:ribosomal protein S18 acetylase RimI-like enzyme
MVAEEDGGGMSGFAVAWEVADELQVLKLSVHSRARRKGIGTLLMVALLSRRCANWRICSVLSG